jgi:hypothetical protein
MKECPFCLGAGGLVEELPKTGEKDRWRCTQCGIHWTTIEAKPETVEWPPDKTPEQPEDFKWWFDGQRWKCGLF